MAAVERLIMITKVGERLDADAAGQLVDAPCQHQHESERKFRAGDIRAATQSANGDAALGTSLLVDTAQVDTIFLHRFERRRRGELLGSDRQTFNDQYACFGEVGLQFLLGFDHPYLGRIELPCLPPDLVAPAGEIRLVVSKKVRIGGDAFFADIGVEYDLNDAQETVVFDDNKIGHKSTRSLVVRFGIDAERHEHAGMHVVDADQHGQFDDLPFGKMRAQSVEHRSGTAMSRVMASA